jgi:hypothetical protein
MANIGGWWLAKFKAWPGEYVEMSFLANRTQSSNRAVGGKLFITNQRIIFLPHLCDHLSGGKIFQASFAEINEISRLPAGGDLFGGGLRDRLKIGLTTYAELFVVNKLDHVIEVLTQRWQDHT